MLSGTPLFAGVDPTAAHKAFTYALLDRELRLVELAEAEAAELVELLANHAAVTVAVNAPSHLNTGLLRQSMQASNAAQHQLRGADMRLAEHELRQRGIPVSGTPGRPASCAAWVRIGLDLYSGLAARGFESYPADGCTHRMLETHPHAAFCGLLGRVPLPRPLLEGRLQRQLVLFEHGLRLRDPMDFFEEITRHRLLNGMMPADLLHTPEQLDALVAAFTAWAASVKTTELSSLGAAEEGPIYLPVAALREKYS